MIVYPVKSCKGIHVECAQMTTHGLAYDRRWMIVDEETGRAVTQRTHPKMALICTSLPPEVIAGEQDASSATLTLSAPGVAGEVKVPLAIAGQPKLRGAKVWAWSGMAADEGDEAAAWLTALLGRPVRMVRYLGTLDPAGGEAAASLSAEAVVAGGGAAGAQGASTALYRAVDESFVPWGSEVAFADGFPVLVAMSESLDELNSRLVQGGEGGPVPMNRFRPNVVLSGVGPAWADDGYGRINLGGDGSGGIDVALVKPCSRCTVPLVNQSTGEVSGKEPIKTMQGYRSGRVLGWDKKIAPQGATFFGHNGQPLGSGTVRVGDPVSVLQPTSWVAAA